MILLDWIRVRVLNIHLQNIEMTLAAAEKAQYAGNFKASAALLNLADKQLEIPEESN